MADRRNPTDSAAVLLSINRAMWCMVTPELRSVSFASDVARVTARFVYDRPIDDRARELVSEMETEVIADLPRETAVEFTAEHLPSTERPALDPGERWVYLRYEERG